MDKLNFLTFDTSTNVLKIALFINNKVYNKEIKKGFNHIENVIPAIQNCIEEVKEEKSLLNYIGVCNGPGSFTGIRIGIAAALGISYALNIKCFGFNVFDVYRYIFNNEESIVVIPVIDAKKNKFFCSFIESNNPITMFDYSLEEIKEKLKIYNSKNKKIVFLGKDFDLIKDEILKECKIFKSISEDFKSDDLLNYSKWLIKSHKDLDDPAPVYLRKSEAELSLLKQKKT